MRTVAIRSRRAVKHYDVNCPVFDGHFNVMCFFGIVHRPD